MDVKAAIGNAKVSSKSMDCASAWLVKKELEVEHNENLKDEYREFKEIDVLCGAYLISSHVLFKIKIEEPGKLRLKARICPH